MKQTEVDEPRARRTIFAALRRSAIDLWGPEGLLRIADVMSVDARRYAVSLSRVKHVTERHWLGEPGTLVVTIQWS